MIDSGFKLSVQYGLLPLALLFVSRWTWLPKDLHSLGLGERYLLCVISNWAPSDTRAPQRSAWSSWGDFKASLWIFWHSSYQDMESVTSPWTWAGLCNCVKGENAVEVLPREFWGPFRKGHGVSVSCFGDTGSGILQPPSKTSRWLRCVKTAWRKRKRLEQPHGACPQLSACSWPRGQTCD